MDHPDFRQARLYALRRLERDLDPCLFYHSIAHTRDEVVPAAERLAIAQGVGGGELLLLLTAAFYHDLGFAHHGNGHEIASVRVVNQVLPGFGYTREQLRLISGMILATDPSRGPSTHLEAILADADLDILGSDRYLSRSYDLRRELEEQGQVMSDEEWYRHQIQFLQEHHYWTQSARVLRGDGVKRNIQTLRSLLDRA
jgi:uncharacterized protein